MAIPEGSNKTIVGVITASVLAVGAGAAIMTGVVPNPFQTAKQTQSTSPAAAKAKTAKTAPAVCRECGTVESIETFTEKGQATGGGAVAGGVIGAIAGHEIEKNVKKVTRYRIALRMDDGTRQVLTLDAAIGVAAGDKVKIVDGTLVRN